jgi:hypothetical protein
MAKSKDLTVVKEGEEVLAKLIKKEDGYHVIDQDGTEGPVCNKRTADGYIILTPNAANRKCVNEALAEATFANGAEFIPLTYKATRTIGSTGPKIPNAKLIEYLNEEDKAEYLAIIERARVAYDADHKKPMTDIEKAEAKVKKAKEALAKLLAEAGE